MFDLYQSLTHAEILLRFKKVFGRDMTPDERDRFFLPPNPSSASGPDTSSD